MADRENMGTNLEPSFVQRVSQGLSFVISGVTPQSWFGPMQPLAPQAQDKTEGRMFDYPVGYNLRIQPRSGENISFNQLRALADGYDLMRLVIETRKDQLESFEWEIIPKDPDAPANKFDEQITAVSQFLESPDKEHNWSEWLRLIVEDLLVIDAVCVYPRQNRGGKLYGFELVDGATIKRLIDDTGRTPLPPSPAYQSILKGIPTADYSRDDLVYMMRNQRTWKIYGYSPVEQVLMTVNIALRRQMHQLEFYTAGNIPEAIAQLPKDWTPALVKEFQGWWDSLMEGNTANRRKMKFIPNLEGILFPKADALKDEYDEWLARIICFAFSISPTAFIKMVNRASGEQMADTAKEEGTLPTLRWLESKMTSLINTYLAPDVKFKFKIINKIDPKAQAEIHGIYMDRHVLTPDEVREDLGREAMSDADREVAFPAPVAASPAPGTEEKPKPREEATLKPEEEAQKLEKFTINNQPPDIHIHQGDTFVRVMPAEAPVTNVHIDAAPAPNVTVNTPEITVNSPDVRVLPADVNVNMGDVHVQTGSNQQVRKGTRTIKTERLADGSMIAKIETEAESPATFHIEKNADNTLLATLDEEK